MISRAEMFEAVGLGDDEVRREWSRRKQCLLNAHISQERLEALYGGRCSVEVVAGQPHEWFDVDVGQLLPQVSCPWCYAAYTPTRSGRPPKRFNSGTCLGRGPRVVRVEIGDIGWTRGTDRLGRLVQLDLHVVGEVWQLDVTMELRRWWETRAQRSAELWLADHLHGWQLGARLMTPTGLAGWRHAEAAMPENVLALPALETRS